MHIPRITIAARTMSLVTLVATAALLPLAAAAESADGNSLEERRAQFQQMLSDGDWEQHIPEHVRERLSDADRQRMEERMNRWRQRAERESEIEQLHQHIEVPGRLKYAAYERVLHGLGLEADQLAAVQAMLGKALSDARLQIQDGGNVEHALLTPSQRGQFERAYESFIESEATEPAHEQSHRPWWKPQPDTLLGAEVASKYDALAHAIMEAELDAQQREQVERIVASAFRRVRSQLLSHDSDVLDTSQRQLLNQHYNRIRDQMDQKLEQHRRFHREQFVELQERRERRQARRERMQERMERWRQRNGR